MKMMRTVTEEELLNGLQALMNQYIKYRDRYGEEDTLTMMYYEWMIGAKELVEMVLECPVNLQKDGKVTLWD